MDSIHALLPWYVNGTLEAGEAASFQEHLAHCQPCRDELTVMNRMQAELQRHGEGLLTDHPTSQTLVTALTTESDEGGQDPHVSQEVRRHVALCSTCADEARWVMKEAAAKGGTAARSPAPTRDASRPASPPGWARAWLVPVAASLLLVAAAVPILQTLRRGTGTTGVIKMRFVEPTQRAGEGQTVIAMPAEAGMVHLVLPVDMVPAAFPLRLEIHHADGRVIHRETLASAGDLYRDAFLFVACRREDCPDGDYLVRLQSEVEAGQVLTYPFRLGAEPANP